MDAFVITFFGILFVVEFIFITKHGFDVKNIKTDLLKHLSFIVKTQSDVGDIIAVIEEHKREIWKLQNPQIYRFGDQINADEIIIKVEICEYCSKFKRYCWEYTKLNLKTKEETIFS